MNANKLGYFKASDGFLVALPVYGFSVDQAFEDIYLEINPELPMGVVQYFGEQIDKLADMLMVIMLFYRL
ncbi:hypothetical protein [Methylotuvimicrobium sp.]|uniref:hypothetical protein n=1 Tax=Methylotuvimicrobium sp. TaxID=2822413 RepID=UPI003D652408